MDEKPSQTSSEINSGMYRKAAQVFMIPMFLGVFPLVYGWIGMRLDRYFETNWLAALFVVLGFYSGIRQSYLIIRRIMEDANRK